MKRLLEKYSYCIDTIEKEFGEYWCYLKENYEFEGCHTIHEDTLKEVEKCLKQVEEVI